jgi:glucan phosphoethanolaminetransferase (alkaline phosphatase superfamily)
MQSGLRPDQLPDVELRSLRNPSIFSYMQRAGFRCYLVNAQNVMRRPPNFMTDEDIAGLDGYLRIRNLEEGLAHHEVDHRIPANLRRIVSETRRSFSYVMKSGAHFPYSARFPQEQRVFESSLYAKEHTESQAAIVADYMNTVRWTVDDFMKELVAALDGARRGILIVYTSDHGQSLYEVLEEGRKPIRGHSHPVDPPPQQAMIPLLLIPLDADLRERISRLTDPAIKNRVSAFEFFSSLLYLAGYDDVDIRRHYHHTIFDSEVDRKGRVFVSGNHFGADGPLYRDAPYSSSFHINQFDPAR